MSDSTLEEPSPPSPPIAHIKRKRGWWSRLQPHDKITLLCTVVNAVAVVAAVVFSALVWTDTQAQGKQNEAKTQLELRAWVATDGVVINKPFSDTENVIVAITVKNTGKTPAIIQSTISGARFSKLRELSDDLITLPPNHAEDSHGIIAAGGEMEVRLEIPAQQLLDFKKLSRNELGPSYFHVFGVIIYEDIFGHPHRTAFYLYRDIGEPTLNWFKLANKWNTLD